MTIHIDTSGLDRFGWMRIDGAITVGLCGRLVEFVEAEMDVPLTNRVGTSTAATRATSSRSGDRNL